MSAPVEGTLTIGKYGIHYVMWGMKGNKIIILHSMGMDAFSMELLCEALQERYQILALTILAHGESAVPEDWVALPEHAELMRECYRRLRFTPCVLIGHSIGGRMGMILAADHPDEIKGLILVDIAPPDPISRTWRPQAPERLVNEEEALTYLKGRYPNFAPEYYKNRVRHGFLRQSDGSLIPKPTGSEKMTSLVTELWPYVERIRVPSFLVLGSESTLVTPEKLERMKKAIPGLEVVTIKGASHMVPQDKPREFELTVSKFLSRISW